MCNNIVIVIVEYDGRRLGLPNAPAAIEYDNNRTEESTVIALNMNNTPYKQTPTFTSKFTWH